eukprot:comp19851_c0_seq1/m.38483 comp19851_c0_seq1/g.38483  ORF comp19851_c0_seq1/g.38483 comp19851_c0_seq1/m.38483 type:complete len:340 (+) comp19851_c0_seq1:69-1088(+)
MWYDTIFLPISLSGSRSAIESESPITGHLVWPSLKYDSIALLSKRTAGCVLRRIGWSMILPESAQSSSLAGGGISGAGAAGFGLDADDGDEGDEGAATARVATPRAAASGESSPIRVLNEAVSRSIGRTGSAVSLSTSLPISRASSLAMNARSNSWSSLLSCCSAATWPLLVLWALLSADTSSGFSERPVIFTDSSASSRLSSLTDMRSTSFVLGCWSPPAAPGAWSTSALQRRARSLRFARGERSSAAPNTGLASPRMLWRICFQKPESGFTRNVASETIDSEARRPFVSCAWLGTLVRATAGSESARQTRSRYGSARSEMRPLWMIAKRNCTDVGGA